MKIPRGDNIAYHKWHTLKKEYKMEMALDLFDICFDLDRTKEFTNKAQKERDIFFLKERAPLISDAYLIDLCNECLTYENVLALNILIEEIAKRNSERESGDRILFFKECENVYLCPENEKTDSYDKY